MNEVLNNEITNEHPFYPYLNHELTQIQSLLESLKPRKIRRSLNFIGSAWKWIAGNPDHEDFEIIKNKINNVLKNNNEQVIINRLYNDRINNITKITNEVLNLIKKESLVNEVLGLNIQYKLKIIKEELINVKYAIHWAKIGIINSLILSNAEVKLAIDTLEKENLPYATPEEALDFANVKIISNDSCLLYIVYIPITTNELYEKLIIKPIKKGNVINEVQYQTILKKNKKIFGIIKECKSINYMSICKQNNILEISNSSCLPNLLESRISRCNKINNQHIPTIDEISEGLILVNQFYGNINIENEMHELNGTYLVKFHNTSLTINDRTFVAKEKSSLQVLPAILQPTPDKQDYKEILSLQMLKDIHINNTDEIKLLQTEKTIIQFTSFGSISLITIIMITLFVYRCRNGSAVTITHKSEIEKPIGTKQQRVDETTNHENHKSLSRTTRSSTASTPVPEKRKTIFLIK